MRRRYATTLIWQMMRAQLMTELQYRANVLMHLNQIVVTVWAGLAGVALVLGQTENLNGWRFPHLLVLVGAFTIVGGLLRAFARPNLGMLIADIHTGSLDYVLLRPADVQLQVSFRRLHAWYLIDVLMGVGIVVWGGALLDQEISLGDVLLFGGTLVLGFVIVNAFLLSLVSTAFWLVRVDEVIELFESIYQAGRWPVSIYPDWMRLGLTFLVPISFALTVPAEALTGRLTATSVAVELVAAVAFVVLGRRFFIAALRHYTGASA